MPKTVWLNGELMPLETATVPAADHAHLYGDGLFEGIRIYNGKVFKLDEHLTRLYQGVKYLAFEMSISQAELRQIILDTCKYADIQNGYIRLNVTRGSGLGLDPKNINKSPNVMVMINELRLYPAEAYEMGLSVVTSAIKVIPPDVLDPRVKCIGRYAANILAKHEANKMGAGEALMLNAQGYVAECTGDNLFLVRDGVIYTPDPASGILLGITRNVVIELARAAGYKVEECFLTLFDIHSADEAFLTGTAAEVIPMISLDNRKIGCGTPGKVTQEIIGLFRKHTDTGVPFN
jgi:branched-chain amino acid aminotransferase